MTRSYKVVVTAGAHSWTVTDVDPPTAGLMDPLSIGWTLTDTEHRPTQPDPMVATFSVVVATAADLDDLVIGALVTMAVTFGPVDKPTPDVEFYGRIAQGEATAHDAGMLYRFTCADLSVDLAGYDLGALAYDPVPVWARLNHMLARAGLDPANSVVRDPVVTNIDLNLWVDGIPQPNAANLLTSLIGLCDQVAFTGYEQGLTTLNYRAVVAPHPLSGAGAGAPPLRWALDAVPDGYVPSPGAQLPGEFGPYYPAPATYGVHLDPDDRAAGVIDACVIEFDSDWVALQSVVANRAAVTWLTAAGLDPEITPRVNQVVYVTETPAPGAPVVTATRETQTLGQTSPDPPSPNIAAAALANAERLGNMMIPAPQNPAGWAPSSFRWLLFADPAGMADFPAIFPRHSLPVDTPALRELRTACYVRPIVVTGIPGRWNAADATRDWVGGQLSSVTLTISDARPVIDFELVPTLPEQGNPTSNAWDEQRGSWNLRTDAWDDQLAGRLIPFRWADPGLVGVTWDQLQPQPWDMYRLAKGA